MERYAAAVSWLSRLSGYVAAGLILLAVLVVCQMLFVRYALGQSAIWQNEFVTFSLVAATFLGAPYVLLLRGHVNVELVPLWLGPRAKRVLGLAASLIGLVFCVLVFITSIEWWWEAWAGGWETSSVWRARLWIPYLSLPVGSLLLSLQYVAEVWAIATGRVPPFGALPGGAEA
ncbi:TRAP transporter small permease [Marinimicrococcus flavescens]|uniref:TRAP transporter small permease protein n=1 Tax=Marinimicrococcus flavescens TaxID=3031815 RepID=A0AAP3XRG1_9PROT|nr:TRAP transporter small permease subunit [Marinimicrococcus flavescens]